VASENVEVVRAFTDAYNSSDIDRLEALCTDEPEIAGIRAAVEETSYVGPDAVRRWWADATQVWSERQLVVEEVAPQAEDTVLVRAVWRGRGRGSGVDVERQLGFRFRIKGGRIESFRTVVDAEGAG
jgi:ketosteroid isomerase-like protein